MMRRLLCGFLALIMVVGMVPSAVFAEEATPGTEPQVTEAATEPKETEAQPTTEPVVTEPAPEESSAPTEESEPSEPSEASDPTEASDPIDATEASEPEDEGIAPASEEEIAPLAVTDLANYLQDDGRYVVTSPVEMSGTLELGGNVLYVEGSGSITVPEGEALTVTGSQTISLEVNGGNLYINGTLNMQCPLFVTNGGNVNVAGTLESSAAIHVAAHNGGNLTVSGTLLSKGYLNIHEGGEVTLNGGEMTAASFSENNGTVWVNQGSVLTVGSSQSVGSTLVSRGNIHVGFGDTGETASVNVIGVLDTAGYLNIMQGHSVHVSGVLQVTDDAGAEATGFVEVNGYMTVTGTLENNTDPGVAVNATGHLDLTSATYSGSGNLVVAHEPWTNGLSVADESKWNATQQSDGSYRMQYGTAGSNVSIASFYFEYKPDGFMVGDTVNVFAELNGDTTGLSYTFNLYYRGMELGEERALRTSTPREELNYSFEVPSVGYWEIELVVSEGNSERLLHSALLQIKEYAVSEIVTDKDSYTLGETVSLTWTYRGTLPSTLPYEVRIRQENGMWSDPIMTGDALSQPITITPTQPGEYYFRIENYVKTFEVVASQNLGIASFYFEYKPDGFMVGDTVNVFAELNGDTTGLSYTFNLYYRGMELGEERALRTSTPREELNYSFEIPSVGWWEIELVVSEGNSERLLHSALLQIKEYAVSEIVTDKDSYTLGEPVNLTWSHRGELPGTLSYEVRIRQENGMWSDPPIMTGDALSQPITITPAEPGEYYFRIENYVKTFVVTSEGTPGRNITVEEFHEDWNQHQGGYIPGDTVYWYTRLNWDADTTGLSYVYYVYKGTAWEDLELYNSYPQNVLDFCFVPDEAGLWAVELVILEGTMEVARAHRSSVIIQKGAVTEIIPSKRGYNLGETASFTWSLRGEMPDQLPYSIGYIDEDYNYSQPIASGTITEMPFTYKPETLGKYYIYIGNETTYFIVTRKNIIIDYITNWGESNMVGQPLQIHMELKPGADLTDTWFIYKTYYMENDQWVFFSESDPVTSQDYWFTPTRDGRWKVAVEIHDQDGLITKDANEYLEVSSINITRFGSDKVAYALNETVSMFVEYEVAEGQSIARAYYEIRESIYNPVDDTYMWGDIVATGDVVDGRFDYFADTAGEFVCSVYLMDQEGSTASRTISFRVSNYGVGIQQLSWSLPQFNKPAEVWVDINGEAPEGMEYRYTLLHSNDRFIYTQKKVTTTTKSSYTYTPNLEGYWRINVELLADGEVLDSDYVELPVSKLVFTELQYLDGDSCSVGQTLRFKLRWKGGTPVTLTYTLNRRGAYGSDLVAENVPINLDGTFSITPEEPGCYDLSVAGATANGIEVWDSMGTINVWEENFSDPLLVSQNYEIQFGEPLTVELTYDGNANISSVTYYLYQLEQVGEYYYPTLEDAITTTEKTCTFIPQGLGEYMVEADVTTESGIDWTVFAERWHLVSESKLVDAKGGEPQTVVIGGKTASYGIMDTAAGMLKAKDIQWSLREEDLAVATISKTGKLTAGKNIYEEQQIRIMAIANNMEFTLDVTLLPAATKVELSHNGILLDAKSVLPLGLQETLTLKADTYPTDAMDAVTWTTSNKNIATVTEEGVVIPGTKTGTVTITATTADGAKKKATMKVEVGNFADNVAITGETSVRSGKAIQLTAAATASGAALKKTFVWTTSDKNVATVSGTGKVSGKTVYEPTEVTITATTKDSKAIAASYTVTVLPKTDEVISIRYQGVNVTAGTLDFDMNDSVQLTVNNADDLVTWKSSSKNVTVDENGNLTFVKAGKVTITATCGKQKAKVTVIAGVHATGIVISGKDVPNSGEHLLASGKSTTLKATLLPSNVSNKKVTWEIISGCKYATISGTGVLKAAKDLNQIVNVTVRVSAKDGSGVSKDYEVKLVPLATGVSIFDIQGQIMPAKMTHNIADGDLKFTAKVYPDLANQGVTWKNSSAKIATIALSDDGYLIVTPLKKGTITLTATANDGSNKKVTLKITFAE